MDKKLRNSQIVGFIFTAAVGTLLHFLYDWSGANPIIALISGVNESTWEHMKLLFWPMLLFTVFQSFFFRDYASFPCVKVRSMLIGLLLIPVLFYTYNGVIGKSPDFINISIFFISAAVAYFYEVCALNNAHTACKFPRLAPIILCAVGVMFIIFTFNTPNWEIFRDPITNRFGI